MIKLNGIEKIYRTDTIETIALNNISLNVEKGEFISVMGPSGSGKSTLLNIMGLIDEPTGGSIQIAGEEIQSFSDKTLSAIRNQRLGFIFQSYHLINDLSILDNVELPLIYRKMSGRERTERALIALDRVGLSSRTSHFPGQLSGGQRQRVAIARAIVGEPDIILADEPTGNLDSAMGADIMDILMKLNEEKEATIVMVTHDEMLARKTRRVIRLFDGAQVFAEAV